MTAIYVRNRLPTPAITTRCTPYKLRYGKKPQYPHLRIGGCLADGVVPQEILMKTDTVGRNCISIGNKQTTIQYSLYNLVRKCFLISYEVVFEESGSYYSTTSILKDAPESYYAPLFERGKERLA
ncbi:hypothetical protein HOY80DRAFT_1029960 [Tuber brumale]|nr:hypothetical protein HOY80DRAFT_1029960 [Tuber brumale]